MASKRMRWIEANPYYYAQLIDACVCDWGGGQCVARALQRGHILNALNPKEALDR